MSQDDPRHPFDADRFLGGFTEESREVPVDPDSPLGQAMAGARESWAENDRPDPAAFTVTPVTVKLDE